ncbi:MAG: hypothetical protein M1838_002506 [Thelocarpon superellum]|nr:MAG: hypothetical protein M1838_002506 [Thelocarpon superellum]
MASSQNAVAFNAWLRRHPEVTTADKIFVRQLCANANVGVDAWGRRRQQPVEISVALSLKQSFTSAAQKDRVDPSTVHYGTLSKAILAAVDGQAQQHLPFDCLRSLVEDAIYSHVASGASLLALQLELSLPKASLIGAAVTLSYACSVGQEGRPYDHARSLHLRDLTVPTVVGVNEHEKERKQRIVVNIWLDVREAEGAAECYGQAEHTVVETIEDKPLETLESLATTIASRLSEVLVSHLLPRGGIRVRVEKPSAVILAVATGVEVVQYHMP